MRSGKYKLTPELISAKVNEVCNACLRHVFFDACVSGDSEIVRCLLSSSRTIDILEDDYTIDSPVNAAIRLGRDDIVNMLLESRAELVIDATTISYFNHLLTNGDLTFAQALIAAGMLPDTRDADGTPIILKLTQMKMWEAVQLLVNQALKPTLQIRQGRPHCVGLQSSDTSLQFDFCLTMEQIPSLAFGREQL